jgi:hypothetical protein
MPRGQFLWLDVNFDARRNWLAESRPLNPFQLVKRATELAVQVCFRA